MQSILLTDIYIITYFVNFCNYFFTILGGNFTKEKWTGQLIGKMHIEEITQQDLAEELGTSKAYISMMLNGARKPKNAREKMEAAFEAVKQKKKQN